MRLNSLTFPSALLVLLLPAGGSLVTRGAPPGPGAGFQPVLVVEAVWPGANAQDVADQVAAPLEHEINGVERLAHMVSRCTNDGRYTLLLSFGSGIDLNLTQVLVQNRISIAEPKLPSEVRNSGVVIRKISPAPPLVVTLTSPDASRDAFYLGNYASLQIKDELARVAGVGAVSLLGAEDWALRIILDPEKLAARGLAAGDVLRALRENNAREKTRPADQPPALETLGRLTDAEGVADIVLKTAPGGSQVRLKDVGRVEVGRGPSRGDVRFDDRPAVALAISVLPTAKPRDVSAAVRERMERLKEAFPPRIDYTVALDLAPRGLAGPPVSPWCLLAEPVLPPGTSAERILDCRNRYAGILRRTEGVRHILSLPENPFARFRGGPCVVAVFDPEMKEENWEQTRQTVRSRLGREVRSAALRLRDLSGPSAPRLDGYPVDLALRGPDAGAVREFGEALATRLNQTGKLTDVAVGPQAAPRIDVDIDRTKAAALGVALADITQALQLAFGPADVGEIKRFGRTGQVQVQLDARLGDRIADIKQLHVRGARGQMVPLSAVVALRDVEAPVSVERVDLRPAATLSANPAPGVSPAAARWLCETLAEQVRNELRLPAEYGLVWLQQVPAPTPMPGVLKPEPEPPPEVTVAQPVVREVVEYQDFTGKIEAAASVELRARVSGYLEQVLFKDGSEVKKGDALFVIDQRPFQAAVDQAQANLKLAEAQRELSKRNLERLRALGAATSRAELEVADAKLHSTAAQVEVARAAVSVARLNLDWTTVRAPIEGRIGRHLLDEGTLVKADDTLLANLVSVDPVHVYFEVDERTVLRLARSARAGKARPFAEADVPALVGLADEAGFPRRGSINFVDNRVNPETGALTMRAVLPNTERSLLPGLFARIRLATGAPHKALLVPEEAIGSDQGQKTVYVVDQENKIVSRAVMVGAKHDGLRVVTEGLRPDDRVVVEGRTRARPGQAVRPVTGKP